MQRHYLADIIEPVVDGEGFETVRILTMGETNQTLQIMIEHKDHDKELTVDDCAKVSRADFGGVGRGGSDRKPLYAGSQFSGA